ncbi:MAG: hypothetical protein ACOX5T_06875 [Candidatus Cryptobacteroides sp.]|jgi:hypothetical protein
MTTFIQAISGAPTTPHSSVFSYFIEGGPFWMALMTLLLVAIFAAAWKAPNWIKEIGLSAFCVGILGTLFGLTQMTGFLQGNADIAAGIIWGGFKVTLIPAIYGSLLLLVSLVVRLIQKPRI